MYYLVKFKKDWADEFNVYGFSIFKKDDWDNLHEKLKKYKDKCAEFSFGTNEGWDEETIGDFLKDITVVPISEMEKSIITKLFGTKDYGHFPYLNDMISEIENGH